MKKKKKKIIKIRFKWNHGYTLSLSLSFSTRIIKGEETTLEEERSESSTANRGWNERLNRAQDAPWSPNKSGPETWQFHALASIDSDRFRDHESAITGLTRLPV